MPFTNYDPSQFPCLLLESGACDLNPCLPDQECIVNPHGGHWCLCPPGTELAEDGYSCEPLRRTCDMWGACSQSCTTILDDKVKCFCRDNYTIQEDLYTCRHNGMMRFYYLLIFLELF